MENLHLRYADPEIPDEWHRDVDVKFRGPFEFQGREWVFKSHEPDGFTLCEEHTRTFHVSLEGGVHLYTGPRPANGAVVSLDGGGGLVRVSDVATAPNDSRRGSFLAERVEQAA